MKLSAVAHLPSKQGTFKMQAVLDDAQKEHIIIYKGEFAGRENVPVRIHSECLTSEVFDSLRCDCKEQLEAALAYFETQGCGVLIYLRQEGRGIGLFNKVEAYALQDTGLDTIEANHQLGFPTDLRTYEIAVSIIRRLEIKSVQILTNNPQKINALRDNGIKIKQTVPLCITPNQFNIEYLKVKKQKMNHSLL